MTPDDLVRLKKIQERCEKAAIPTFDWTENHESFIRNAWEDVPFLLGLLREMGGGIEL